jgi:hypothetical protein
MSDEQRSDEQLQVLANAVAFWRLHPDRAERDVALDLLELELAVLPYEELAEVLRRAG